MDLLGAKFLKLVIIAVSFVGKKIYAIKISF